MPLFSVVIPLYNKELHIKRAIDSVLAQNVQDFEIIIVDDGSTDRSAEVVKSFTDPRIRLIHQENAGAAAARNKGIEEARAELISFLDADDEWMPDFIKIILHLKEKYPNAGIYSTAYKKCNQRGEMRNLKCKSIPNPPWEGLLRNYFVNVVEGFSLSASSVTIPKKILLEMGGFQIGYWWGEDIDLWGRIALKYSIAFSSQIGSIYYLNSTNRACLRNVPIKEPPFVKIGKETIKYGKTSAKLNEDVKEYIAYLQIATARRNLYANNKKNALNILKNCETRRFYTKKILMVFLALILCRFFKTMYDEVEEATRVFENYVDRLSQNSIHFCNWIMSVADFKFK